MDVERHRRMISRAGLSTELWTDALESFGTELGSMGGVFWCYDSAGGEFVRSPIAMWGAHDADEAVRFTEECGTPEPWIIGAVRAGRLGTNAVVTGEELSTRAEWEKGPWADFEKAYGARRLLTLHRVDGLGRPKLGISFFRPLSSESFERESVLSLGELARDFELNIDVMRDYAAVRAKASHLEGMLDTLDEPAFLTTPQARIVWMNAAAEKLLCEGGALCLSGGSLRLQTVEHDRFARTCHEAGNGQASVIVFRNVRNELSRLRFAPIESQGQSLVAIFVKSEGGTTRDADQRTHLMKTFGLTEAEYEVARLLSSGSTPSEIARERGTALTTVRSQLSSIFQKLGVSNQAQAVAALKPKID